LSFAFPYSVNIVKNKEASIVRYFLFVCKGYLLVPSSLQGGQREEVFDTVQILSSNGRSESSTGQ
jgi:hypothetical protein